MPRRTSSRSGLHGYGYGRRNTKRTAGKGDGYGYSQTVSALQGARPSNVMVKLPAQTDRQTNRQTDRQNRKTGRQTTHAHHTHTEKISASTPDLQT